MSQNTKNTKQKTEKITPAVQLRQLAQYIRTHATRRTLAAYGAVGLTALLIMLGVKLSYTITGQRYYPFMLSYASVCYSVLASIMMLGYIRHSRRFRIKYPVLSWILAVSYGLSGFFVTQENTWTTCVIGVLLPLLVLFMEDVVDQVRFLPFIILSGIILSFDSMIAVPVMILLLIYAITDRLASSHFTFGDCITYLGVFLLSFLLGSWRIVYQYIVCWMEHGDYQYPGFASFYGISTFFNRLLFGNVTSYTFFSTSHKWDGYVSLLGLVGVLLFLNQTQISIKKRISYFILYVICVLMSITSVGYYILHLMSYDEPVTLGYSCVLIFIVLRMASEAFSYINEIRLPHLIRMGIFYVLVLASAWLMSAHNFHSYAVWIQILMVIVYIILLAGLHHNWKLCTVFLLIVCVGEIAAQTYISTNSSMAVRGASNTQQLSQGCIALLHKHYMDDEKEDVNLNTNRSKEEKQSNSQTYSEFLEKHRAEDVENVMRLLQQQVRVTDKKMIKLTGKKLPNIFEETNARAKILGIREPVFSELKINLKFVGDNKKRTSKINDKLYEIDYIDDYSHPDGGLLTYQFSHKKSNQDIYVLCNSDNALVKYAKGEDAKGYLFIEDVKPVVYNVSFIAYTMDNKAFDQLTTKIDQTDESNQNNYLIFDYVGAVLSYIGLMIVLFFLFYNNKADVISKCKAIPERADRCRFIRRLSKWLYDHRIYIVAFIIPFSVWMLTLLVTNSQPFGKNCLLDSDGIALTIPTITDNWFQNRYTGNEYFSMNLGYGFNLGIYYTYHLLGKIYALFPYSDILGILSVQIAISMGMIGWSAAYYMFHRKKSLSADVNDWYVLIPSMIYSLCSFVVAMRIYPTWLITYALFPLILVKMDDLIENKKWFGYILLLGVCVCWEIQLALFVCIYLFMRFFTYRFSDIRDFITKGIRFGICSIWGAGCGFFSIARTLQAYQNSYYQENDSAFQGFGFYHNFLKQWKDFLPLSNVIAVSNDDGAVIGFVGMVSLFLIVTFMVSKSVSRREKVARIIPIIIILVSVNEKALSYVWNGFHYQTMVPARYMFILIFLLGEIAYDCVIVIRKITKTEVALMLCALVTLCLVIIGWRTDLDVWGSIAWIAVVYSCIAIGFMWIKRTEKIRQMLMILLAVELSIQFCYSVNSVNTSDLMTSYGNINNITEKYSTITDLAVCGVRSINISSYNDTSNSGQYYNSGNINIFNSYVDFAQMKTNRLFGYSYGGNNIKSNYCSSLEGSSLAGVKYIWLPMASIEKHQNIERYEYLGQLGGYYIFENPYAIAAGFIVPEQGIKKQLSFGTPGGEDSLSSYYGREYDDISCNQLVTYEAGKNSFYYTDGLHQKITVDQLLQKENDKDQKTHIVKMVISFDANASGDAYIYMDQMVYLGNVEKGNRYEFTINYPRDAFHNRSQYVIDIRNTEVEKRFLKDVKKSSLKNVIQKNDTIYADCKNVQDGYLMFSLSYSKNWRAYIDGQETEVKCYNDSTMYVEMPEGEHKVILRYIPYHYRMYQLISVGLFGMLIIFKMILKFRLYGWEKKRGKAVLLVK